MDEGSPQRPVPAPAPTRAGRLEPGTIVDGRWRITRRLGAMRLDEIYEASDGDTGETVAIRVVRRDDGSDDATFRRFARVARRLAGIRHPNVQRIHAFTTFEFRSGTSRERLALLVTELLTGETLSHRVRRAGPLRGKFADALVHELCHGLEAIHTARALHGDLTGASVLFVQDDDGHERAVLTDLAFLASGEGDDQAMARAVGSPAYRAPEQLTGGKLQRTSDVFSLGAVIYEAVTGRLPFTGGNLLALDFRQLEEQPRPPGELTPGIAPAHERAILRCLERSPLERFERAPDLLRAMAGESVSTPRVRQAVRTLGAASMLIAVMIGGSALLSWISVVEERRLGIELVNRSRPAIAVFPFRASRIAAQDTWIAVAASDLLRLELLHDDALRVAPREAVVDACRDLELSGSETLAPEALRHVRTLIGAEQVLVGSCTVDRVARGATVTLDLCLQDSRTGETVGAIFETGSLAELPDLVVRVAKRVDQFAGAAGPAPRGSPAGEQWSPAGLEAWARGLANLDARRAEQAVSALTLAATTDANNSAVLESLSRALWASGDVSRAIDESKRAWDASEGLSRERVLELELRHAELRNDPIRVIEAHRRMIRTYPDRIDHGFGLVDAFIRAGDLDDATRALRSLNSATSTSLDPRPALFTARIDARSGRFSKALSSASDAAAIASSIGAKGIEAEAEVERALAAAALGEYDIATTAIRRATEAFRARGDLDEVARVTAVSAMLDERLGKHAAALASLREAERIYEEIGQRQGLAATRGSIAGLLAGRGRHRDAARAFSSALDGFVAIGDHANATRTRIGLAASLTSLGALAAAESQLRGIAAQGAHEEDPHHRRLALLGRARVETLRGRVTRSREFLDQAAKEFDARRDDDSGREIEILRGVNAWLEGDEGLARSILQSANKRALEQGLEASACRATIHLARIDLWSGNASAALTAASACLERLRDEGTPADATTARSIATLAALRLDDREHATAILEEGDDGSDDEEDFAARGISEIAHESLRGGRPSAMLRLAAEADAASMRLVQLDALLAASDLATRPADRSTGESALLQADQLARRLGLTGYTRLVDSARARRTK